MKRTTKILIGGVCVAGVAIATGYATYKAHDKIETARSEGKGFVDIVKCVAKDYIPAAVAVLGTGAFAIASEVIDERELNKLKSACKKIESRFDQVSNWYKAEHKAVVEKCTDEQVKAIEEEVKKATLIHPTNDWYEACDIYDPITRITYHTSRNDMYLAVAEINKRMYFDGFCMYEDLYKMFDFDEPFPEEFTNYGWSQGEASALWLAGWIELDFIERDGYLELVFLSEAGGNTSREYPPIDGPCDDCWN